MRVRINSIRLVGTDRALSFEPGLNIIAGPITTGKTTLLNLCRALLGTSISNITPELRVATAIAGEVLIGDHQFSVVRSLVTTNTAPVDVAGNGLALRLPAMTSTPESDLTYGAWLLEQLGLPILQVPRAPTQADSEPTPVSISDYMNYCVLSQDEIDSSVFGHRDSFKNIKRQYVFRILYGLYGIETAQLHEELRNTARRIRALRADEGTLARILQDTEWANRADLLEQLRLAEETLGNSVQMNVELATQATSSSEATELKRRVLELDDRIGSMQSEITLGEATITRLTDLSAQLSAQSGRLTRSIVAGTLLLDFEFRRCPRCSTTVSPQRGSDDLCLLCLQEPTPTYDRRDLVREQDRLEAQISETTQLIKSHQSRSDLLRRNLTRLNEQRGSVARRLDQATQAYISDNATAIAQSAESRTRWEETVRRLRDYLHLFENFDNARQELTSLEEQEQTLQMRIERDEASRISAWSRVQHLESRFQEILGDLHVPEIGPLEESFIDKNSLLPIVQGRRFDNLSSLGLKVLVNVAHALAHHESGIAQGIPIPGILFIDGPSSNIGQEGEDLARIESIYQKLIDFGNQLGDELQIIVADNNVPDYASPYVRLRLSEEERLIPASNLLN